MSSNEHDASPLSSVAELPGVGAAVDEARGAMDNLLAHRALRRGSGDVATESALRGARASAALEGSDVPLHVVRSGGSDDPVVQGALRVSAELTSMANTWRRAPLQVLARLHVLAATGCASADELGRPRVHGRASDPFELGEPHEPSVVSARLDGLSQLVASERSAPATVLAAVVHGELLVLRPFGSADGVVARAAERLTLLTLGLDAASLAAPEVGHWELRDNYGAAIRSYAAGTREGVAAWVRHCAEALSLGTRESVAIGEALLRSRQ